MSEAILLAKIDRLLHEIIECGGETQVLARETHAALHDLAALLSPEVQIRESVMKLPIAREDLLDEVADALSDANDLDVGWHDFAAAVLEVLEKHGVTFEDPPNDDRPMRVGGGAS